MPATERPGLFPRISFALILLITLIITPAALMASEGEGPVHGVMHMHLHEHGIPELASAVDYYRAIIAKVIVKGEGADFAPVKGEEGVYKLTDTQADFLSAGVGRKGQFGVDKEGKVIDKYRLVENMVYSVWITEGPHAGRYVVKDIDAHELWLISLHHGGKEAAKGEEKSEGAEKVAYKIKEEHTLTSNVFGEGLMGINWTDLTNILFAFLTIVFLSALCFLGTRKKSKIPAGLQALLEMIVGGLDTFTKGILGEHNRAYLPLVGTLFLYILCMALMGLLPAAKSPIALNYNMPLALALVVFAFVQYHSVKQNGVGSYLKHLLGEPIWLFPLQFPLHVMGEFIKPLSLSLRLFANISAEDILVAALVLMMVFLPWYVPVPLQILFYPLALLFSLIQALVFMSLTSVYIAIMFPHGEEHH